LRVAYPGRRRWPARGGVAGLPAAAVLACPPRRWPASRRHGLQVTLPGPSPGGWPGMGTSNAVNAPC